MLHFPTDDGVSTVDLHLPPGYRWKVKRAGWTGAAHVRLKKGYRTLIKVQIVVSGEDATEETAAALSAAAQLAHLEHASKPKPELL